MMTEQAIVHKILITQIGQRVSFQVRLPKDARRLIGLEYDARKISGNAYVSFLNAYVNFLFVDEGGEGDPPLFGTQGDPSFRPNPNKLIGRLSLRNSFCEGLFYQGNLVEDNNTEQYEGIALQGYVPKPWMHSTRREEIGINVNPGLIQGFFEDSYGVNSHTELEYELILYFWIEKCSNDN
ncbi:MAG: hypothetical protein J0I32_05860 [Sphingobacteriales bacterium]|nr:hypothetical protein [Sphingobacteriales bacterium]